jgi:WD40 repeat protein/serine/threonine protein kinase/tetratricopeptide (TPR) repeat protein
VCAWQTRSSYFRPGATTNLKLASKIGSEYGTLQVKACRNCKTFFGIVAGPISPGFMEQSMSDRTELPDGREFDQEPEDTINVLSAGSEPASGSINGSLDTTPPPDPAALTRPQGADGDHTIDQDNVTRMVDAFAGMLSPEQQDLDDTLPQASLRPKSAFTSSSSESVSVRPRGIQSASESELPGRSEAQQKSDDDLDYLTLQMLGQGGMGTVHLARQVALGRSVALKQIQPKHRQRQSVQQEFLTEAVLTGKLEHPNIVPIYEVGRSPQGDLFYSMKNIQGQAWDDSIGNLSLDENLDILINVCDAIAFAHTQGVIHRDLKPQNIMTAGFGEVLVLDWGLAVQSGPDGYTESSPAGTPAYMAPEMVNPPFRVGLHCDIYLLGGILFRILTGGSPHVGKSARESLEAASSNEIASYDEAHVNSLDPSGELMATALKAMATEPEDRFQTTLEFQQAIRDFLSHQDSLELSTRAQGSLNSANADNDYTHYSRAVFGFEESLKLWPGNETATQGVVTARLSWALCAEVQGDFDLSLSLLDDTQVEQQEVRVRVTAARDERDARQHHAHRLRRLSLATGVLILVGALGFGAYQKRVTGTLSRQRDTISEQFDSISTEQEKTKQALVAEEKAKEMEAVQRLAAEKHRSTAEQLRVVAEQQRDKAVRQLYLNHVVSAQREWETNNATTAWMHLNACPPTQRGWEHSYLQSLFSRSNQSFVGHTGLIMSLAVNADGSRIVSGGTDKSIKLWDVRTGKETRTIVGHANTVSSVAFSLDGKKIASGSYDGTAKIWDATTGEIISTLNGNTGWVFCVAFSPDSKQLVCGNQDHSYQLWDVATEQKTVTLTGHKNIGWSVAFSPDGRQIATGSWDDTIKLWDVKTGNATATLQGHTSSISSVGFNPDGTRIVSGCADNTLKVWDTTSLKETFTLKGHNHSVVCSAFSPDGSRIVSGSYDNTFKLWDAKTGVLISTQKGHAGWVNAVAFTPDGNHIVTGSEDQTLKLWDANPGEETLTLKGHAKEVMSAVFSPDGSRIVSGSYDGSLKLWDADSGQEILTFWGHPKEVLSVAFSPDGSHVASGSVDETVRVWNVLTGEETLTLIGHTSVIWNVAFSPDGSLIASASEDSTAKLWDANTGELKFTLKGHDPVVEGNPLEGVLGVAFSPDGKRIVTCSSDKTLKLWDTSTGTETLTLRGQTDHLLTVAFSPDGTRIVSGGYGKKLKLWDAKLGTEIATLPGHSGNIWSVAFSPDGRNIVSGSEDNTVKVWDATTGEETLTLRGHIFVESVAFSPDGRRIVSASKDKTLKVWDARNLQSHENSAATAEASNDWFAAAFHLGCLMALHPDNAALQKRRATAETKLIAGSLPIPKTPSLRAALNSYGLTRTGLLHARNVQGAESIIPEILARQEKRESNSDPSLTHHVHLLLGVDCYMNGDFSGAIEHLTHAKDHPTNQSTELLLLSLAHHESEQGEPARAAYDQAIKQLANSSVNAIQWQLAKQAMKEVGGLDDQTAAAQIVGFKEAVRLQQSVPFREKTYAVYLEKLGEADPQTISAMGMLTQIYLYTNQPKKALPLLEQFVAVQRSKATATDSSFAVFLVNVSRDLVERQHFLAAEKYLRECITRFEKQQPDVWLLFDAKSLLGGALLGQKKFAEAEPLLVAGYEGMHQRESTIPAKDKSRLTEAVQRLVQYYEATDQLEKANDWRKKLM